MALMTITVSGDTRDEIAEELKTALLEFGASATASSAPAKPAPKAEPKKVDVEASKQPQAEAPKGTLAVTLDQLKKLASDLILGGKKPEVKDLLENQFDGKKVTEIDEDQYADLYTALEAING